MGHLLPPGRYGSREKVTKQSHYKITPWGVLIYIYIHIYISSLKHLNDTPIMTFSHACINAQKIHKAITYTKLPLMIYIFGSHLYYTSFKYCLCCFTLWKQQRYVQLIWSISSQFFLCRKNFGRIYYQFAFWLKTDWQFINYLSTIELRYMSVINWSTKICCVQN